jgi:hypothetical protein
MTAPEVGVDCTGSTTVAVLRHPDGRVEHLRFDDAAELPSGVYQSDNGQLLTGRAALDASIHDPTHYIAVPLDLLTSAPPADDASRPAAIVATVLGRVRQQAIHAAGAPVVNATVVVPPGWGPQRRTRLRDAAHRAGLTDITIVDAATALAHHHAAKATPGQHRIMVLRLTGPDAEATILTRNNRGFDVLATISNGNTADVDAPALADHAATITTQVLTAAELTSTAITTTVLVAPTTRVAAIAAGLQQLGITAQTRTAANADTVLGALTAATGQATSTPRRLPQARHAVAIAVPLPGAAALLWLLLHTAVYPFTMLAQQLAAPTNHILTLWPAWGMTSVLVFAGAIATVLRGADQELRQPTGNAETGRRNLLTGGLRVAAGATVTIGILTAMLGATTYPTISLTELVFWAVGPAVLLAAVAILIAALIRDGHTSALRWQIWLRLPNTTAVLAAAGLLLVQADLYLRQYWPIGRADLPLGPDPVAPTGLDRLGAIAIALAILPLLIRRIQHQVLVSPVVITLVLLTQTYTNTNLLIGALLVAMSLWWITRIRPAAAYSDPGHPASILAADLEAAPRAGHLTPTRRN